MKLVQLFFRPDSRSRFDQIGSRSFFHHALSSNIEFGHAQASNGCRWKSDKNRFSKVIQKNCYQAKLGLPGGLKVG
jgi:hypothetical protein